jgi:hypothetical protein
MREKNPFILAIFLALAFYVYMRFINGSAVEIFDAFLVFNALSCFIIAYKMYKKEVVDRLILGVSLFGLIETVPFLGNISSTFYYDYAGVILFASIAFIGAVTFFSRAGFIGVLSDDKNKVYSASLKLFAVVIAGFLWSLYVSIYLENDLSIYLLLPIAITRLAYDILGDQVRGKKSDWSFKW